MTHPEPPNSAPFAGDLPQALRAGETTPAPPLAASRNPRRWLILVALCLSLMVVVADNTVLTVAIPPIMSALHTDMADVQWILDAYIVVFAGLLITAGALSDRFGRRRCLIVGLVLFGGASIPAAYADSIGTLIAARALMGVGGAFLMPGTLSILTNVFDDEERKKAIAIWSTSLMVGAVGAPLLGGVLLAHFWWGSVFLINIPVAVIAIIAAVLIIPESRGPQVRPDVAGSILSTIGMAALVWAIISTQRDGWGSWQALAGYAVAVVGLTAFALRQRTAAEPMLPLGLFRNRDFTGASVSLVLLAFSAGGLMLALTQLLQFVLGYSPLKTGLALIPMIVAAAIFNGLGVVLSNKLGTRVAVVTGMALLAAGFGVLATMSPGDGYVRLVIALVVAGAGSGTAGPAAYNTLLSAVPPERAGVGSAVNDTVNQTGQALSVAVLGSVLTAYYAAKLPSGMPGAARESLAQALATAVARHDPGLAATAKGAYVDGLASMALVGAIGILVAAAVAFVVLRPRPAAPKAAD